MDEFVDQIKTAGEFKEELIFLKFKYIEIKDLLKHFLTLISATLVFSVTFSEKIINFQKAPLKQKLTLYLSWGSLVLSLGLCGYGLYTNYLAAEIALNRISDLNNNSFKSTASFSYLIQDIAAIFFCIGLTLLISTSLFKMKNNNL